VIGKVPSEEWFVDGNVLDGHNTFGAGDVDNAVNQQKRIAVRQDTQYLLDVERKIIATGRRIRHVTHEAS
jgi:hypothetical protein